MRVFVVAAKDDNGHVLEVSVCSSLMRVSEVLRSMRSVWGIVVSPLSRAHRSLLATDADVAVDVDHDGDSRTGYASIYSKSVLS